MTRRGEGTGWEFVGGEGDFRVENPQRTSGLYFPLCNQAGMMASVSPLLGGDLKTDQNHFLLEPVSVDDLHLKRGGRNFWIWTGDLGAWSACGHSAAQASRRFGPGEEGAEMEAGLLWHRVRRRGPGGLESEVTNFVPWGDDRVELMKVRLTNTSGLPLKVVPTAAVPIFGRSADNLRDHRHVTSLLHRIGTLREGVLARPELSFDERGHQPNRVSYAVLGRGPGGAAPAGFFPDMADFIGEGGTLDWPLAVVANRGDFLPAGAALRGAEAMGALRFPETVLVPGGSAAWVLLLAVLEDEAAVPGLLAAYGGEREFDRALGETRRAWSGLTGTLRFESGDQDHDRWLRWVAAQPVLRRIFGCSFLPHHDYGRGGRGWRDLWQDCLALLLMDAPGVGGSLFDNFGGVRMDGSNATIIGPGPGEFVADRNNIPRVWMDHGAWPWLTTRLYLDFSGDLDFLLRPQAYFKDGLAARGRERDALWSDDQGTRLRDSGGAEARGSILEHLLVQHLCAFFNRGEHHNILLEGADWNDGLDMARERGESVAFTALYAGNLADLAAVIRALRDRRGLASVELAGELLPLLDTLSRPLDYGSAKARRAVLQAYFDSCRHRISGRKAAVPLEALAADLEAKAAWDFARLRRDEWTGDGRGGEWFNGYWDNQGRRVEGAFPSGARMTLTGQVFPLMAGVATPEQAAKTARAVRRHLFDAAVGGCRLNTDFGGMRFDLGRCFGFAYGHKENGAVFSHMAVMYANALYRQGMAREAFEVLETLCGHCRDFEKSRMYPGLPEYLDPRGRGLYSYLTGSASWLLLTLLTESFGFRGDLGDLRLKPRLVKGQFGPDKTCAVHAPFAGRALKLLVRNPEGLEYGSYSLRSVRLAGRSVPCAGDSALIPRAWIEALDHGREHLLEVGLGS